MGRVTQELDLKQTQSGTAVLSFTLAVERQFVKQGEERQADFISCVAWRQQAEFISKFDENSTSSSIKTAATND